MQRAEEQVAVIVGCRQTRVKRTSDRPRCQPALGGVRSKGSRRSELVNRGLGGSPLTIPALLFKVHPTPSLLPW